MQVCWGPQRHLLVTPVTRPTYCSDIQVWAGRNRASDTSGLAAARHRDASQQLHRLWASSRLVMPVISKRTEFERIPHESMQGDIIPPPLCELTAGTSVLLWYAHFRLSDLLQCSCFGCAALVYIWSGLAFALQIRWEGITLCFRGFEDFFSLALPLSLISQWFLWLGQVDLCGILAAHQDVA